MSVDASFNKLVNPHKDHNPLKCGGKNTLCICHEYIYSAPIIASNKETKDSKFKLDFGKSKSQDVKNKIVYTQAKHWLLDEKTGRTCSCGCGKMITKKNLCIRMPLLHGGWLGAYSSLKCLGSQFAKNMADHKKIILKTKSAIIKEEQERIRLAEGFYNHKFLVDLNGFNGLDVNEKSTKTKASKTEKAVKAVKAVNAVKTSKSETARKLVL